MSKLKHYLAISQTFYILFLSHTKKCLLISSILFPVSRFPCTSRQKKALESAAHAKRDHILSPPPELHPILFTIPPGPPVRHFSYPWHSDLRLQSPAPIPFPRYSVTIWMPLRFPSFAGMLRNAK